MYSYRLTNGNPQVTLVVTGGLMIKLKNNSYRVDFTHNRKRYRKSFQSLDSAKLWEAQTKAQLLAGKRQHFKSSKGNFLCDSLGKMAEWTYQSQWKNTKSELKTWCNTKSLLFYFGEDYSLNLLDRESIDNLVLYLRDQEGNSPSTINKKLSNLRVICKTAYDLGVIPAMPNFPKRLKEPPGRMRWFTLEEQELILKTLQEIDPEARDMIVILLDTGMRSSELISLKPNDLRDGVIHLSDTKNSMPRSIPMTDRVKETFSRYPDMFRLDYDQLRRRWDKMKRVLDLGEDAKIHSCRHTFVSTLVQKNVNLRIVQQLSGHKDINMVVRYSHLQQEDLVNAINKL
tara:strand:- start:13445 stop:14473 length:1029 start_codon:yes stop_codon:yes gene_type:complete